MTQKVKPMVIRSVVLVEKNNLGLYQELGISPTTTVPETGDSFQLLKPDESGEYCEYHVSHRLFREVPDPKHVDLAEFRVVCIMIRRAVQWQP